MEEPTPTLAEALGQRQLVLPQEQVAGLEQYCRTLWAWNEKLNLTRHTDYEKFVSRDLVDCVQLAELLEPGESVLDVGSGGGVPGVVLAILRPDLQLSLAESVGKKAAALESIVQELGLELSVLPSRAEKILSEHTFRTLVARAVGPLWKMLKWFENDWDHFERLLAIKGPRWVAERGEARHRGYMKDLDLRKVSSYPMPGTESESVILQISGKRAHDRQR